MSIDWQQFTPAASLGGGLLIGLAAAIMILFTGRVAGISGIIGGLLRIVAGDRSWRLAFLVGMLMSSFAAFLPGWHISLQIDAGWPAVIAAGFIVGLGTRYAGGCTSGHGVCGLSRGAMRSVVATVVFMVTGFLTVFVLRHVVGG